MTCEQGREVYECESGTCYVVYKHRDTRSVCTHEIAGLPSASDDKGRWFTFSTTTASR